MTTFNKFDDGDTEGANVNVVDSDNPQNKQSVDEHGRARVEADSNAIGEGVYGALQVPTTVVELRVEATRYPNRRVVTLFNNSGNRRIYWGFDSSVTATTGTVIEPDELMVWTLDPERDLEIWLISSQGNNNVRITESR